MLRIKELYERQYINIHYIDSFNFIKFEHIYKVFKNHWPELKAEAIDRVRLHTSQITTNFFTEPFDSEAYMWVGSNIEVFLNLVLMRSNHSNFKHQIDSLKLWLDNASINQFIKQWESKVLGKLPDCECYRSDHQLQKNIWATAEPATDNSMSEVTPWE